MRGISAAGAATLESDVDSISAAADRIRTRLATSTEDIVEIGRDLLFVKAKLGHGRFLTWIDTQFGLSPSTANRFMRVAANLKDVTVTNLPAAAVYELAATSTPESVLQEVSRRVERGDNVTTAEVRDLKAAAKTLAKHDPNVTTSGAAQRLKDVALLRQLAGRMTALLGSQVLSEPTDLETLAALSEIASELLAAFPVSVRQDIARPRPGATNDLVATSSQDGEQCAFWPTADDHIVEQRARPQPLQPTKEADTVQVKTAVEDGHRHSEENRDFEINEHTKLPRGPDLPGCLDRRHQSSCQAQL